jgi:uncharacterized protein (DUF58 family)
MFRKHWFYPGLIILLAGLLLREPPLVLLATLVIASLSLAGLWNRYALVGLQYQRQFAETRVFPGETIDLTLRVLNRKPLPLPWLELTDTVPLKLPPLKGQYGVSSVPTLGTLSHLVDLRWYERVSWHYRLMAKERGYYTFGPLTLRSGDVFGFFETESRWQQNDHLIVYPRLVPLEKLGLPSKQPFGETKSLQRIFEDPSRTIGIRDYQREDAFKRIHWKATARRQALQVRVYEPTSILHLVICLNIATMREYWQGVDPVLLEGTISVAASLADYGLRERYSVGLLANGSLPESDQPIRVLPGRSPRQLTAILEALAKITPFPIADMGSFLDSEASRLPWGATLVVVSGVADEGLLTALVHLREAGRRVVLVSVGGGAFPPGALRNIVHYNLKCPD